MDKVEHFINKRFPYNSNWTNGNCYWFAKILTERFTHLKIYYNYQVGHFGAFDVQRGVWYDWEGKHEAIPRTCYSLSYLKKHDPKWYRRLLRDCVEQEYTVFKGVYDIFKHYYHGGNIYFYSDPHFGDADMNERRHITDEEQIKEINSRLGKCDTIIFLGDIGDKKYLKKIRGYKVLILGNHDAGASNYKKRYYYESKFDGSRVYSDIDSAAFATIEMNHTYGYTLKDNGLCDEVYEGVLMLGEKLILSHEPVDFQFALNVHGHVHAFGSEDKMHYNVCAEHISYHPVPITEIIKSGILKEVPNIHRITIDKQVERANKRKRR